MFKFLGPLSDYYFLLCACPNSSLGIPGSHLMSNWITIVDLSDRHPPTTTMSHTHIRSSPIIHPTPFHKRRLISHNLLHHLFNLNLQNWLTLRYHALCLIQKAHVLISQQITVRYALIVLRNMAFRMRMPASEFLPLIVRHKELPSVALARPVVVFPRDD